MKNIAIIVAGGMGKRFGGERPKQFSELGGKPILNYSLEQFQKSPSADGIALVLPDSEVSQSLKLKDEFPKLRWIAPAGERRQDSTFSGFRAIPECKVVLVHDAVRPFVSSETIERLIKEVDKYGACIAGAPARDTIKEVDGGNVIRRTLDRSVLWQVHTPQAFRYSILKEALEKAFADEFYGTDEAMLVERLGRQVKVIDGGRTYLKVTFPEDMLMARAIIEGEEGR